MDEVRILLVDDDVAILNALKMLLEKDYDHIELAQDGEEALDKIKKTRFHLIILDVMMPRLDGLSTLMKLREEANIPVLLLSAKTEDSDKVLGLAIGADDYVSKPYNPSELRARVKSLLRRYMHLGDISQNLNHQEIKVDGLLLNPDTKMFYVDGEPVKLTQTEFKIMELLMKNPNMVFSSEKIYERVWNEPAYSVENTVMVHIRRIREKIEINPKNPKYLKVVWGIGYKIEKNTK